MFKYSIFAACVVFSRLVFSQCRQYGRYSQEQHEPYSTGEYHLPYQRPVHYCRKFAVPEVDRTIRRLRKVIKDPDLHRLFENTWPNTLDTTVKWRGHANNTDDEELTFIITGDINAMWLRDSASQIEPYLPILKASSDPDSLASLWRGVINLQARNIIEAPYCNAFQAPPESGMQRYNNMGADEVTPYYDPLAVFSCDYELDSLASFLQISSHYAEKTGDYEFFGKHQWVKAVRALMNVSQDMMTPTYADDGKVLQSPFTFTVMTRFGGAPINGGKGSPVNSDTGLIRSFFRPSDDACIYQFLIPSNMMFSVYLGHASKIMKKIPGNHDLAQSMEKLSSNLREAIQREAIFNNTKYGSIYAYEVDGYGSSNMMDDANVPSLLSAPYLGFVDIDDEVYQNTRKKILSKENPYFGRGPVISAVGGPHDGPGKVWPMSLIMRVMTSNDDEEIYETLKQLLSSTDGLGLMHESINTFNAGDWTRHWFSWANGLFGQMILDLEKRKPHILAKSFQK